MSARLISIIGPPAAGKTTLAEALAAELSARVIREDYAGNPFLAESYVGQADARLPGQLYFLVSRVGQLARACWPAAGLAVSDYGFCQDRVYARMRLAAGDYAAYDHVASRLELLVHPPDVVISLDASVATLRARIAVRGRDHERVMTEAFLQDMRSAYAALTPQLECPVLTVDCDTTDLRQDSPRRELIDAIRRTLAIPEAPVI